MTVAAVANQPWPTGLVEPFTRDPGGLALVPLAAWWLVVLGWVATTDRLSQDAAARGLDAGRWGMILAFPFLAAAVAAWWIPTVFAAIPLMMLAWWGSMVAYARARNAKLPSNESILTVAHAKRMLRDTLDRFGISLSAAESASTTLLPAVSLAGDSTASPDDQSKRLQAASGLPGFTDAATLIAETVNVGGAAVLLEFGKDEVPVRQEIDGVWQSVKAWEWRREKRTRFEQCVPAPPMPKATAAGLRAALLTLAGIDPRAVKARASGRFVAKIDGKPWLGRVLMQRSTAGEAFVTRFEPQAIPFKSVADLGIDDDLAGRVMGLLSLEKGFFMIASPPSSGGSTTFDRLINATDRLIRNFVSIEDATAASREIQNVKPFRFDPRTGGTPSQALASALREYPQVLVAADLTDGPLAGELVSRADAENLVVVGLRASDSIDAIERLLALGVDREKLAASLLGVLAQRLVRRLCPKCRQEQPTPPETLVKLRMTAEQFPSIFTASKEGCRLCNGSGYRGRTGIFELAAGGAVRPEITNKSGRVDLQKVAIKAGMRPLSQAGMRLVVEGVTSYEELQRVFKAPARR